MKRLVFIVSLIALTLASCSKLERNEKKYLEGMMSEDYETSIKAFDEFADWMLNDRSTMTYDFKLMREKMDLKIVSSPDGHLRLYSWPTSVNEKVKVYANLSQWTSGDNFIGFNGPIDKLLAGRNAKIKQHSSLAHSIDSIYQIQVGKQTVYLIAQSYHNTDGNYRAYVSATFIDGVVLRLLPNFFDGIEIAGNYEITDADGKVNAADLFKWDDKAKRFYAYQTDDSNHVVPGKYAIYQLNGDRFIRLNDPLAEAE